MGPNPAGPLGSQAQLPPHNTSAPTCPFSNRGQFSSQEHTERTCLSFHTDTARRDTVYPQHCSRVHHAGRGLRCALFPSLPPAEFFKFCGPLPTEGKASPATGSGFKSQHSHSPGGATSLNMGLQSKQGASIEIPSARSWGPCCATPRGPQGLGGSGPEMDGVSAETRPPTRFQLEKCVNRRAQLRQDSPGTTTPH